jgi:tetratricopeptide (TPR) repeat protein
MTKKRTEKEALDNNNVEATIIQIKQTAINVRDQEKDPQKALFIYQQALELDPNGLYQETANVYWGVGTCYFLQENYQEAHNCFKKAADIYTQFALLQDTKDALEYAKRCTSKFNESSKICKFIILSNVFLYLIDTCLEQI